MRKKLFVFESNPDFSDNSRGFWEYIKNKEDVSTFWCVRDENMLQRMQTQGIHCALFHTDEANEMIEKADCFITSSFEFAYFKKKNQIHVSAWHGFPLKLIGFFDKASGEDDFSNLKVITTQSDIITATSRTCQLNMSGMLSVDPNKVKITGFPRNDLIFQSDGKQNLKKLFNVDMNSRFIFYLPTMRKGLKKEGKQFEENIFNYADYDLNELDAFLEKNNAYIVAKMHFADNPYFTSTKFNLPKRILFLDTDSLNKENLTIYHIMNAFDILITDYSSVYVDYLLLDRPIIFSCPDLEEYKKDRGFVVDDPSLLMPGEIVNTQDQLLKVLHFNLEGIDKYKAIRKTMMPWFHSYIDSNSSKRLYEEILLKMNGNDIDYDKSLGKMYLPKESTLYNYFLKLNTEVYLDRGNGLNENDKVLIHKEINENSEKVFYKLENLEETKYIRFDPDFKGHWILKDVTIKSNGNNLDYNIYNGIRLENYVYFMKDDPQIHIDLQEKNVQAIEISFEIYDAYLEDTLFEGFNKMYMKNNELQQEILSIKNSKYWKAGEPIRKLKNKR